MRAVNLIPVGERRGVGNTSGLGSYIVLGSARAASSR